MLRIQRRRAGWARVLPYVMLALITTWSICGAREELHWNNPIRAGLEPHGLRDCFVFREGKKWCLTGTAYPVWPRDDRFGLINPGVVLYTSDDLVHWVFENVLVRPNPEKWYGERFWAPEIHKFNGKYFVTFNCRNSRLGDAYMHTGYAVSNNLRGPYQVMAQPLSLGNDLTLYQDVDQSVWAFWNRTVEPGADRPAVREFGIGFARVNLDRGMLLEPARRAIPLGREHTDWDGSGIEGASIYKHGPIYYLLFSSWTRGYEIGYATAPRLDGPWSKYPGNPIFGGQDVAVCRRSGVTFSADPTEPFCQAGHCTVFEDAAGAAWLSCHGILRDDDQQIPGLVIAPLPLGQDGHIIASFPNRSEQTFILSP